MTACKVVCLECADKKGRPKQWRYLCLECAEEKQTAHRQDTGHTTDLIVVEEAMAEIRERSKVLARRFGW